MCAGMHKSQTCPFCFVLLNSSKFLYKPHFLNYRKPLRRFYTITVYMSCIFKERQIHARYVLVLYPMHYIHDGCFSGLPLLTFINCCFLTYIYNPIQCIQAQSPINLALQQRASEYSTVSGLRLCVATYNVNGGKEYSAADLYDWYVDIMVTNIKNFEPLY